MALPQFWSSTNGLDNQMPSGANKLGMEDDSISQTEEQEPNGGSFQSGKWYGNSASGSIAPGTVLEQVWSTSFLVDMVIYDFVFL